MNFQRSILLLFILILGKTVTAQSFEGIWKGTSLCQIKNSPCHDEVVVYHISKDSNGNSYEVIANKIVDGKEDYMGTIPFTYDSKQKVFVSVDSVRNARWEFKITGSVMKGTLMYKGDLFRIIDVKKEN
jgi:stress response protein SCP2